MAFCGRGKVLHFLPQGALSNFYIPFDKFLSYLAASPFIFATRIRKAIVPPIHKGIQPRHTIEPRTRGQLRHEFSVIEKAMVTVSEDEAQLDPRYHQRNRPVISPCPFLSARVCYKEEGEEAVV